MYTYAVIVYNAKHLWYVYSYLHCFTRKYCFSNLSPKFSRSLLTTVIIHTAGKETAEAMMPEISSVFRLGHGENMGCGNGITIGKQ